MKTTFVQRCLLMSLLTALIFVLPGLASAETTFGRIVVFGDSLSDPGNAYALRGGVNTPPYGDPLKMDAFVIPDVPYAKGGHHFSDGATWVEQFARPLGLAGNTRPAFDASSIDASNYAVGGARAYEDGTNVNLPDQVNRFLTVFGSAPSDALYVIEFGGNDIRDALSFGNPAIIGDALTSIGNNVVLLYANGARKFLVWNAPNLALTPAIRNIDKLNPGAAFYAGALTDAFNYNLNDLLNSLAALPGIEIVRLDAYGTLDELVKNPAGFGLTVVDGACVMPGVAPFECQTPDEYLFWDGIHPTGAVHGIFAQKAEFILTH